MCAYYCCLLRDINPKVVSSSQENMFSISFRKHRDEKKKNNLLPLIIKI